MLTIVAHSDHVDSRQAALELVAQAEAGLQGQTPRGGLLYATTEYDHAVLQRTLQERWPGLALIGASTAGELSSRLGFRADSACLTLFAGERIELVAARSVEPSKDLGKAVDAIVASLGDRRPALAVMHCPGTVGNASAVSKALHERLGDRACPIVGGLAGDHTVTTHTCQLYGTQSDYDSLVVMFFCGEVKVSWGVASGWFPIGTRHRVTRATGNKVHEIDGRPAIDIYQSFWGDRVTGNLGEFPLAVWQGTGADDFMLRAAMSVDPVEGSVTFAGDVAEGSIVSLTEVVPEGLLSGTRTSIERAVAGYHGTQTPAALLFSCAARKWVLGSRASGEIDSLVESMGKLGMPAIDFAGFYAFGEICPLALDGPPLLHNETCVTVLVGS